MALFADLLVQLCVEVVAVADDALIVARPLESYGALFNRDMAQTAFQFPVQLLFVKGMNVEIRGSGAPTGRLTGRLTE